MEEVAGDNSENKILCIITKMKPVFIFIIIIAIVAVYFIFFKENKDMYKCENDTKTKSSAGLLRVPCYAVGLSLDETKDYVNNLNNFIKDRSKKPSSSDKNDILDIIGKPKTALDDNEQKAVKDLTFVTKSMGFNISYNDVYENYELKINDTPAKYVAPGNIEVILSGIQKQVYNLNIYVTNLYDYINNHKTIPDYVAVQTAVFMNLYIMMNNILNFIQTH
jgi:hypothetical protein